MNAERRTVISLYLRCSSINDFSKQANWGTAKFNPICTGGALIERTPIIFCLPSGRK